MSLPCNYRPISLVSVKRKIFEKLLPKIIINFSIINSLDCNKRSTIAAIVETIEGLIASKITNNLAHCTLSGSYEVFDNNEQNTHSQVSLLQTEMCYS